MDKQAEAPKTLGEAIDGMIKALGSLDESSRITAIKAVCDHLKIRLSESQAMEQPPSRLTPPNKKIPEPPPTARLVDIKSLRQEKQPSSVSEMAALVAFYLSELAPDDERKKEVRSEDMIKYFKHAGFPLPKRPDMLLTNAKNAGYFDSVGAGAHKLNAVGYNLVAHGLPRTASGSTSAKPRRKTRNQKARPLKKKSK